MAGTTITCPTDTNTYTMAQRMLDAAICAYSVTPSGFHPDCKYWAPIKVKGPAYPFQVGTEEINAGFVATTEDDWVVLSLRGTLSGWHNWDSFLAFIDDWLNDDKTKLVPMWQNGVLLGNVHKGFYESSTQSWAQVQAYLHAVDWSKMKGLQITGHSKGAGMCFIMAAMARLALAHGKYGPPKTIEVNAFAAPLAGDAAFAASYKGLLKLDKSTTRHQRAHDIVPFLPSYDSWDIFKHMEASIEHPESWLIVGALEALRLEIHGGYHLVGSPIFYPGTDPVGYSAVIGRAAIPMSQAAILAAIKGGYASEIADAHSSMYSYWPALFQKANPRPSLDELTEQVAGEMGCGV